MLQASAVNPLIQGERVPVSYQHFFAPKSSAAQLTRGLSFQLGQFACEPADNINRTVVKQVYLRARPAFSWHGSQQMRRSVPVHWCVTT
jgi:hypothetical protein